MQWPSSTTTPSQSEIFSVKAVIVDCYIEYFTSVDIPGADTVAVAVAVGFLFFFPSDTSGAFDVDPDGSIFTNIAVETADDASCFTKIEQAIWNLQWAVTVY